jgi:hypothetical protein
LRETRVFIGGNLPEREDSFDESSYGNSRVSSRAGAESPFVELSHGGRRYGRILIPCHSDAQRRNPYRIKDVACRPQSLGAIGIPRRVAPRNDNANINYET